MRNVGQIGDPPLTVALLLSEPLAIDVTRQVQLLDPLQPGLQPRQPGIAPGRLLRRRWLGQQLPPVLAE